MNAPKHTWPVLVTQKEVYIRGGRSEWYAGDQDIMGAEEWREARLIAAAPALLRMLDVFLKDGARLKNIKEAESLLAWVNSSERIES